jgi:hypothetical protein
MTPRLEPEEHPSYSGSIGSRSHVPEPISLRPILSVETWSRQHHVEMYSGIERCWIDRERAKNADSQSPANL